MALESGTLDVEAQGETLRLTESLSSQSHYASTSPSQLERNDESQIFDDSDSDDPDQAHTEGDGSDIVQFSAPIYYAAEEGGFVRLEILRLGGHKGSVSVFFYTEEGTAQAHKNYTSVEKEIVFRNGQGLRTINIPILEDDEWSPTTEFSVHLKNAHGCTVGLDIPTARVKIINNDAFPSEAYRDVVNEDGTMKDVDAWNLYWNFLWFNFRFGGVGKQSVICVCLDQLTNICLFVSLCIAVYMVDVLFDRGSDTRQHIMTKDRYHDAVLIGSWYVIPVVILFLRDAYKARLDVEGVTQAFLRKCTMRTFLQYSENSRALIGSSDLNIAVYSNASAVARGYVAGIRLPESFGKIFTVSLFIFLYQPHVQVFCMVALMPILLLLFTYVRLGPALRAEQDVSIETRQLIVLAEEACLKYRLIADYFRRYIISDRFSLAADNHKKSMELQTFVALCTAHITKFITGFFICTYIILNAGAVLEGRLSLGLFLATISIFATYLSDAIMELNKNLQVIMESFLALETTTLQFNFPLEDGDLKAVSDYRRQKTLVERRELRSKRMEQTQHQADEVVTDAVEIQLQNVSFKHSGKPSYVLENINLSVAQGTMIAVTGSHNSNKKTLMDLLADTLLPTVGHVFIPSHLRVLHVPREPMFLDTSLSHNLTLGLPRERKIDMERVATILRLLDLPNVPDMIDKGEEQQSDLLTPRDLGQEHPESLTIRDSAWVTMFCHTQRIKLHICRALIADPNVMILQRPLHHFSETVGNEILKVVRMHIESRGLGHRDSEKRTMRPRTVFVNTETPSQANAADVIWTMNPLAKSVDVSFPTKGGTKG